jgi:hypothetical protein
VTLRSDDLDARFPGLLHAVLSSADEQNVGSEVSIATGKQGG